MLLAVLCGLALLAACSSRYSAEPPDYVAAQFGQRPPEDGTVTLYPTNGPYGGTPAVDFEQVGDTVFAATRLGLYRSDDAGQTWERTPGQPEAPIAGLVSLPQSLIAAASPDLYRSDDRGDSWQRITPESATCAAIHRRSMAVVGSQLFLLCGSQIYVSDDDGSSWLSEGFVQQYGPQISSLVVADNTLFGFAPNVDTFWRIENWPPQVRVQHIEGGWVSDIEDIVSFKGTLVGVSPGGLISPKGGSDLWSVRQRAPEGKQILSAASGEEMLVVATIGGVYRSDLIKEWGPPTHEGVFVNLVKALGGRVYASTSSGILVEEDAGEWVRTNSGIVGPIGKIEFATSSVLALANGQLFETRDFGESWQMAQDPGLRESVGDFSAFGDRVVLWADENVFVRSSASTPWRGLDYTPVSPVQDVTYSDPAIALCAESIHVGPRVVTRFNAAAGTPGNLRAARSMDGGETWQALPPPSPGATRSQFVCLSDANEERVLFAYGDRGVQRLAGDGESWRDLATPTLLNPDVATLFLIGSTLYSGGNRGTISEINLDDIEAGWSLVGAKPTIGNIMTLWIDSGSLRETVPQVIIAGTNNGLYVTDGGVEDFRKVDTGSLPIRFEEVNSLDYADGHLLIATDAGVYYGVDKISRPWPENMSGYVIWGLIGTSLVFAFVFNYFDERRKKARDAEQRLVEEERQKTVRAEVEGARNAMRHVLQLPDEGFERPGIKVAHHLRQSTTVSGDFYNIIPRSDGSVGIYLVDIEGHGLVAAQKAQDVHRVLTDTSLDWGKGEAREQLEIADRRIREQLGDRNIAVTMNFTEIDPQRKVIRYANAGMPTPLLFHAGEAEPEPLRAAGVYVGAGYARHPAKPERAELSYRDGDILVLYSDGITESLDSQGKMFERRGILNAVTATRTGTAEDISGAILKAVSTHAGSDEPQDDQTLLVVRLGDQAETARVGEPEPVRITNHPDGSLEASLLDVVGVYAEVDKTLKPAVFDWLMRYGCSQDRSRDIWNPVWEAVLNGLWHGSDPGDEVYFYARLKEPGRIEIDLRQPNLWRDWDRFLGDQRRKLVTESKELMIQGTTVILRGTESVSVSNHGRQIVLRFRLSGPSDTLSS